VDRKKRARSFVGLLSDFKFMCFWSRTSIVDQLELGSRRIERMRSFLTLGDRDKRLDRNVNLVYNISWRLGPVRGNNEVDAKSLVASVAYLRLEDTCASDMFCEAPPQE